MDSVKQTINNFREKLETGGFINNHKTNPEDFTRDRVLNFATVFMLILKKGVKSVQLALNELFIQGSTSKPVTVSAYTQARKKFKHTAFIELNDDTVRIYYNSNEQIKRWKGFRCFGCDSSVIIFPKSDDIRAEFGEKKIKNQEMEDWYSSAMFLCYYDVLNNMAFKSELADSYSYEADVAAKMLDESIQEDDLLIYDRGFAAYEFFAALTMRKKNYLVRCSRKSFGAVRPLFEKGKQTSKIVTLTAPVKKLNSIKEKGLPTTIKVRLVSVLLSTGEIEVLATSLMDHEISCNDFKALYHLRWGVETFYYIIKSRLDLENFTGKTVESVKQDFWSTILICNMESVLTKNVEVELNENLKEGQLIKKANHAVSFNAIKNMAYEILFSKNSNTPEVVAKLRILFKMNPNVKREGRNPPREKRNYRTSYNHAKRTKKHVF